MLASKKFIIDLLGLREALFEESARLGASAGSVLRRAVFEVLQRAVAANVLEPSEIQGVQETDLDHRGTGVCSADPTAGRRDLWGARLYRLDSPFQQLVQALQGKPSTFLRYALVRYLNEVKQLRGDHTLEAVLERSKVKAFRVSRGNPQVLDVFFGNPA